MRTHQPTKTSCYADCFAFYGRVSTEDNQDPQSSFNWQISLAQSLIAPRGGRIVQEFFDIGQSRSLPWARRPDAGRLLATLKDPHRGFDHVVIGEPHRAFYGNQFGLTMPLFAHYGVTLWVPEVGGPIDADNEAHDLVMSVFGGMSKGERNRVKVRVRTAMTTQTLVQGRFLGGRPPYGYTLQELGPHPNPQKAADGKRLNGLAPDPVTAPIVARIFADFLNGNGIYAIAEALTAEGIPCPSASDPRRNPHRTGKAWAKSAVRVILTNPRYTGRQVWNKQRTDEVLLDVNDVALGHTPVMRWNPKDQWIISHDLVHEPLISQDTFDAAQDLLTRHARQGAPHKPHRSRHPYVFKSLVYCALCQRRMQGQHSHNTAYYRCRYPAEYGLANRVNHPKSVILREDVLITPIDQWLATTFSPTQRQQTIQALASQLQPHTTPAITPAAPDIDRYETKLARYRAALDAGADPAVVAEWIAQTQHERDQTLARQQPTPAPANDKIKTMTVTDITALIDELGDIAAAIGEADPDDKLHLYRSLHLRLTYSPQTQTVHATIDLGEHRWDLVRVRGGTQTPTPRTCEQDTCSSRTPI